MSELNKDTSVLTVTIWGCDDFFPSAMHYFIEVYNPLGSSDLPIPEAISKPFQQSSIYFIIVS